MLNYFRILFIFCIHLDIDNALWLHKKIGLRVIPFELFPFVILEKDVLVSAYLAKKIWNLFIFCIKVDIDKGSQKRGLEVIPLELFPFVIIEKAIDSAFLIFLNNLRNLLIRTEYLCNTVLRVPSGPRVKLAGRKSALTPLPHAVVYSTDRSKAVVPVFVLPLFILVYSTRRFVLSLTFVLFCYCFFQPL